jgi:hypothetical protein
MAAKSTISGATPHRREEGGASRPNPVVAVLVSGWKFTRSACRQRGPDEAYAALW